MSLYVAGASVYGNQEIILSSPRKGVPFIFIFPVPIPEAWQYHCTCHKLLCNKTRYFRLQLIRLPNHPANAGHLRVILIFIFCLPWFMAFWYWCVKVFWWTSPGTWWTTYSPCCRSSPSNPGYWVASMMIEYTSNNHLNKRKCFNPFRITAKNDDGGRGIISMVPLVFLFKMILPQKRILLSPRLVPTGWRDRRKKTFKIIWVGQTLKMLYQNCPKKEGTISAYNTLEIPFDTFAKF